MPLLIFTPEIILREHGKIIKLSTKPRKFWEMTDDDFSIQMCSPTNYLAAFQYNGFLTCTTPIITWEKSLYLYETEEIVLDFLTQQINKIRTGKNALEFIVKAKSFMSYYEFDYMREEYNLFTEYKYIFRYTLPVITPIFAIEQTEIVYVESEIDFKVNFHCSFCYSTMRIDFIVNYYSPTAIVKQTFPNDYLHACILSNRLAIEQAKQLVIDTFTHFRANSWEELLLKTATFTTSISVEELLPKVFSPGAVHEFKIEKSKVINH
jgi:hypothetical protein